MKTHLVSWKFVENKLKTLIENFITFIFKNTWVFFHFLFSIFLSSRAIFLFFLYFFRIIWKIEKMIFNFPEKENSWKIPIISVWWNSYEVQFNKFSNWTANLPHKNSANALKVKHQYPYENWVVNIKRIKIIPKISVFSRFSSYFFVASYCSQRCLSAFHMLSNEFHRHKLSWKCLFW